MLRAPATAPTPPLDAPADRASGSPPKTASRWACGGVERIVAALDG